ncbi:hypothetical protein [Labilibacter marinus]|uniref:hypothetical protein n=1 Tax=Labilibacter marinus TaxID=1477105 RepID=UPI001300E390|nr:hypothetical protein [Labilibacter marinus]
MTKPKEDVNIVQATKEGRMYIKSEDFFKQKKVRVLLKKLENSSILKTIEDNKNRLESA